MMMVMELVECGDLMEDFHYPDEAVLEPLLKYRQTQRKLKKLKDSIADLGNTLFHLQEMSVDSKDPDSVANEKSKLLAEYATLEAVRPPAIEPILQSDARLSFALRLRIVMDIAGALEVLHSQSPGNLDCHLKR